MCESLKKAEYKKMVHSTMDSAPISETSPCKYTGSLSLEKKIKPFVWSQLPDNNTPDSPCRPGTGGQSVGSHFHQTTWPFLIKLFVKNSEPNLCVGSGAESEVLEY